MNDFSDKNLKQRLTIFTIISFLLPVLITIPLYIAKTKGIDVITFGFTHMLLPAMGVIIGNIFYNDNNQINKFYAMYISITIAYVMLSISNIFIHKNVCEILQYVLLIIGSLLCYFLLKKCNHSELRKNGLDLKVPLKMFKYVALFTILYTLEITLRCLASNELNILIKDFFRVKNVINILFILPTYLIGYIIYFGEEYGWRYFLQPILQHKFGKRFGILILGIIWGIWHLPLRLFESNTISNGLIYMIAQLGICIAFGIFLGYIYMKTQNIWIVTIIHFLNNNLLSIFIRTKELSDNTNISIKDSLIASLISILVYGWVIFSKVFSKKDEEPLA